MPNKQHRVYLDLEYLYPGMTRETGRPTTNEQRQVVQMAAILFDHATGTEIALFDQLTQPTYTKSLPPFFTELTGITQEHLNADGIPFARALAELSTFSSNIPIWIFDRDEEVLRQNCDYLNLPFPFAQSPFIRVKALLPSWGIDPDYYSSGTLYQATGLHMNGRVHNALHDVRSMAHAVHLFERRDKKRQIH